MDKIKSKSYVSIEKRHLIDWFDTCIALSGLLDAATTQWVKNGVPTPGSTMYASTRLAEVAEELERVIMGVEEEDVPF